MSLLLFHVEENKEITEVLYGIESTVNRGVQFMQNAHEHMDLFGEKNGPSIIIEYSDIYKNNYIAAKNRGVKIRFITEITKENIHYCKEILNMVTEMRHLEGLVGGIAVTEKEYMTTTTLKNKQLLTQVFYSNAFEVVKQGQYIFDTFWEKAIPADQRIKEIEEGIEPIKTKVLENQEEIYGHIRFAIKRSTERFVCSSIGGMQLVYNNFFNLYKDIIARQKKGEGDGIKWLTYIDDNKNSIQLVKTFLDAGIQVRHIKNLPPMNFSVDSKSIQATIEGMDKGKFMNNLLVSNEPAYIKHYMLIFQELWDNYGVNAIERIRNIEEGLEYDTEVIIHSNRTLDLYLDIVQSTQSEILFIFPTPKAFVRQLKPIFLAKQISKEKKVKVRILTPINEEVKAWINRLLHIEEGQEKEDADYEKDNDINSIIHSIKSISYEDIEIRYIEKMAQTKATILVADRKESLVMELEDDNKDTFIEAIGQSIHSTSRAGVLSYVAIFENLWRQSELYHELRESNENLVTANEQLKNNDKMQKEFINTAAHELRTPIQPILSLSYLLVNEIKDEKQQEMLKIIYKSAKKLTSLTKDILDVTKIEGNKLDLNKSAFNIMELLQSIITEFEQSLEYNKKIKFVLNFNNVDSNTTVIVLADRSRISEVISNLINNSIKFISRENNIKQKEEQEDKEEEDIDGRIIVNVQTIKTNNDTNEHYLGKNIDKVVVVSIKDDGQGIDLDIFPRLFTKFASKSFQGTGLGLYISKNIVEAHGGKIWAKNNEEEKGATFSFSLPVANN